jgi:hypothetical protein
MRLLKSVILLAAVSVGVAVFCSFGSMFGIWGGTRSGVLARDGSSSPRLQNDANGPPPSSGASIQAEKQQRFRGRPPIPPDVTHTPRRRGGPKVKLADQHRR